MKHACREASRLASDALERELSVWEAFRLRLHLLLCGRCRNFRRSLRIMHETLERIRQSLETEPKLSEEQRQKLILAIEKEISCP